jgi:hypothetical protein
MEISQLNTLYSYLKQTKMSLSYKNREQEGKTGPVWGVGMSRGGRYKERVWEGEYGRNIMYSWMKMEKRDMWRSH